ncbi:MAG: hypothetical protein JWO48_1154 [Bryobacterales bacterium]|nr:hypothetical protein [Bryobacterales bacterium]
MVEFRSNAVHAGGVQRNILVLVFIFAAAAPLAVGSVMSSASVSCAGQLASSQTGTSSAQASGCGTIGTPGGGASAQATYGVLTSNAVAGFPSLTSLSPIDARGTSSFSEMATILGGTGTGNVTYNFLLTGELVENGGGNAAPFTVTQGTDTILSLGDSDVQTQARATGSCLRDCIVNLVFSTHSESFSFGVPFSFGATLTAEAFNYQGPASSDLTATLQSISVTDASGNPVNFSVNFDQGGEVPEPATWLLAASGLALLLFSRRGIFRRAAGL